RRTSPKGLAPEPRAATGAPRRFVAQSSDWHPRAAAGERVEGARAAREAPAPFASERVEGARAAREAPAPFSREESSSTRPVLTDDAPLAISMVTPPSTGTEPTRVKGSIVLCALEVLRGAP